MNCGCRAVRPPQTAGAWWNIGHNCCFGCYCRCYRRCYSSEKAGFPKPPRREAPIDLQLPPITELSDLKTMMLAVADAAARGTVTSAQAGALVRMLAVVLQWTR
jgi:hypothetical protein